MFETVRQHLAPFNEYPVENFHLVLRGRTMENDTAYEIASKAKELMPVNMGCIPFNFLFDKCAT